ncbi:hypothetical protein [Rhizobium ruizarguesonis]|uniref:hypothetical protein n=1 Tax=Rhizobium ruizarguesonis TaxID=2081791 RepID=UPI000370AC36|nr:hypothetical protein [Rhizobium ruizarguesonis]TAY86254.1 hypothetical protein ELH85_30475 [Rhizobium ruizarguesonis]TAZ69920.1 hypothetical protein ELH68_28325 [Rhizobium ruizarguesonis]TAZ92325.1 hypothetical protein ELH64_26010 [Rhizobium ruizarguesonis]TBA11647.1 hypothetical protein ELH61_33850 [Rhizobium ruizarguesonis]TBA35560.1 hypothetical protein ELH63_26915 [Rhizobium ruizarguesonis]
MRMKLVAASVLAIGMATSAFAQSNPAPAGATIDKNHVDQGGEKVKTPMGTDTTTTNSTTGGTMKTGRTKCPNPVNNSSNLQTQGGTSNATPMDEACAAHNN